GRWSDEGRPSDPLARHWRAAGGHGLHIYRAHRLAQPADRRRASEGLPMTPSNALEGFVDAWLDVISPLVEAVDDERAFAALLAQMSWTAQTLDLDELAAAVGTIASTVTALRDELSLESLPELVQTLVSLGE